MTTLMRAQHEKIKKENAERAQALQEKIRVRTEKKKEMVKEEGKRMEGVKRGMRALKGIKKYQTSTDLLI